MPARGTTPEPESDRTFSVRAIGHVRSALRSRGEAPRQGSEGAPDAWLEIEADVGAGLEGIASGDEVIVLTWFHESSRDVLRLHPRDDPSLPITGVFATRSPDRPNPIGLHRVTLLEIAAGLRLRVSGLEAFDGTPVLDLKLVLDRTRER